MVVRRFPYTGAMRRSIRALELEGHRADRIEVDLAGNFTVVIAHDDTAPPADLIRDEPPEAA